MSFSSTNKFFFSKKILIFLLLYYLAIIIKNAWLCDDAFITFRVIDNFVNGYGLTWNVIERVQVFTNPLWLFTLSGFYFFTHEIFFTSLFVSIALIAFVLYFITFRISKNNMDAMLCISILASSRAFTDYTTSGLENPLTYLLIVVFFGIYLDTKVVSVKTTFWLSLVAGLGLFNRMDLALIFLPALTYIFFKNLSVRGFAAMLAGFLPFLLWEIFALFYYGFPFPNTAYAKLNTGIPPVELAKQGYSYFIHSLKNDPVTLPVIFLSICTAKFNRQLPIILGVVLYLAYIVSIGGDFMSGRFFAVPLLCSAILLLNKFSSGTVIAPIILFFLLSLAINATCSTGHCLRVEEVIAQYKSGRLDDKTANKISFDHGILLERVVYSPFTGLFDNIRNPIFENHPSVKAGKTAKMQALTGVKEVENVLAIGFYGYHAGAKVFVLDPLALSDPLLSKLHIDYNGSFWIGHFKRNIPAGYEETLQSGQNKIKDEKLAAYYRNLVLITRGSLFDPKRLQAIWMINTKQYDHLLPQNSTVYSDPPRDS